MERLLDGGETCRRGGSRPEDDGMEPTDVGERDSRRQGKREQMSGCGPGGHDGLTSPRRFSIRAGPMPGIASRSSTEVKGPCSVR